MWNEVGMARNEKGLSQAIADIQALRESFMDILVQVLQWNEPRAR